MVRNRVTPCHGLNPFLLNKACHGTHYPFFLSEVRLHSRSWMIMLVCVFELTCGLTQMHGQDDEITLILATLRRRCTLVPHKASQRYRLPWFWLFVNRIYIFFANGKNANVGSVLGFFGIENRVSPMRFSPFLRSMRRQQRPNCRFEHRRLLHKPPCHESMT